MTKFLLISALALSSMINFGCTADTAKHTEPNVELIQDMMESPAIKAQDFDTFDRMKSASRLPPEGTVPVGFAHYPYHLQPDQAEKNLKNPYAGNTTVEIIELGRTKFETYCAVCHGYEGKGDGPVSVKMSVKPPSLLTEKIRAQYNDGRIFHVITDGQGVMSAYSYQLVNPNDRWAIVQYVRSLQRMDSSSAAKSPKAKD